MLKSNSKSILSLSIISIILLSNGFKSQGQNLILNPGGESGTPITTGWTAISSGSACFTGNGWRIAGNQNGFPTAHSGTFMFFTGCGGTGTGVNYELRQDINVSVNSILIDASKYNFTFSCYTQSFSQTPTDQATILVEYRNAANTVVLSSYSTGATTNIAGWVNYIDTRLAPVGTRFIRIRLIASNWNGSSIDGYFDDLSLVGFTVIPLHFIGFQAYIQNDKVDLYWQTVNEVNNKGFFVERSTNETNWESIAFIPANNSLNDKHNYHFVDELPMQGENMYRLKQMDFSDTYSYSEIRTVRINSIANSLSIYPNPVQNELYIHSNKEIICIRIFNGQGKLLKTIPYHIPIKLDFLSKGIYFVKVQGKDFTLIKKLFKL